MSQPSRNIAARRSVLLATLFLALLMVAPPASAQETGPGLPETTLWLSQNLLTLTTAATSRRKQPGTQSPETRVAITGADFTGCQMKYTRRTTEHVQRRTSESDVVTTDVYSVPLNLLRPSAIVSKAHAGDVTPAMYGSIEFTASAPAIVWSSVTIDEIGTKEIKATGQHVAAVTMEGDDGALLQRVLKAMNHAIALCNAQNKQDLF